MTNKSPLLEAQEKFIAAIPSHAVAAETVALKDALDRIACKNITAPEDSPAYNRAIVEGFLVNTADTQDASDDNPISFEIVGNVAPGDETCPAFGTGEAVEVQTGSVLPDGPVSVVRMWEANREDKRFTITRPFPPRFFIEDRGCDLKKDATIIEAGTKIIPGHIGTLASLGIDRIEVAKQPIVTIFASGDEVIPHTDPLRPGLIRDCNSPMLAAAAQAAGAQPVQSGIVSDDFDGFVEKVKTALETSDIIIISGGTAVGGRDFISDLIREVGTLLVDGVPMKSGRPLIMGIAGNKPIIAVAGHPPEALRGFNLFAAPAIAKLTGQQVDLPED